jgi:hypothetical protein
LSRSRSPVNDEPSTARPVWLHAACRQSSIARTAFAWGDAGHEIVALIAEHYLDPAVRDKVSAMLAADTDSLIAHDIASEATWADKYRDSDRNGSKERYRATWQWHFVDIELTDPNLDRACLGHPQLPAGTIASNGPPAACIVDKIDQFAAELADPATNPEERQLALKFVLHFVGDLHQPLHAADDHDAGGNRKPVNAEGSQPGNLHHFWDTEFVERLGRDPKQVATDLIGAMTDAQRREWSQGTAADWALEAFTLGRDHAYGLLPQSAIQGVYVLDVAYVAAADRDVRLQLSRAGARLAFVLNRAVGPLP